MPRLKVDLKFPQQAILWKLYQSAESGERSTLTTADIGDYLDFSKQIVDVCVDMMEKSGHCHTREVEDLAPYPFTQSSIKTDYTLVRITRSGISLVDGWTDDYYDQLVRRIHEGRPLEQFEAYLAGDIQHDDKPPAPASDRFVTLDHNSDEYKAALIATREFVLEAEKSNEFAALFANPDDRLVVLNELKAGIGLLEKNRARVKTLKDLIVRNLRSLANKLPEATLSALIGRALDAMAKLLDKLGVM